MSTPCVYLAYDCVGGPLDGTKAYYDGAWHFTTHSDQKAVYEVHQNAKLVFKEATT